MSNEPRKIELVTEDRFAAVIMSYLRSPKFKGYSEATQKAWGGELRFMARPDCLGALTRSEIRPALVQAFFDGLTGRPGKQSVALAALKQLEKWALIRDVLTRPITLGVETEELEGGHIPWSAEHVALAEKYARPDLARVITLGANTGQRGSDLIRMGWGDIETYDGIDGIKVRQKKTKREVWVPITSTLAAAMKTWERRPGPFCLRTDGRPWQRNLITLSWQHHRESNPHLAPLRAIGPDLDRPAVLHGLRGHACVRLLHAGANTRQIADMVGMSEQMVAQYTRFSVQRENASAAVYHMERTLRERAALKANKNGL